MTTESVEITEITIKEQGAVKVNCAYIAHESANIVCIYIDLNSKRIAEPIYGIDENGFPEIFLAAGEYGIHLDESKPKDSMTFMVFPKYKGWEIFCCEGPHRYVVKLVLVKKMKLKKQQEKEKVKS